VISGTCSLDWTFAMGNYLVITGYWMTEDRWSLVVIIIIIILFTFILFITDSPGAKGDTYHVIRIIQKHC